jgi:hypothetical protein
MLQCSEEILPNGVERIQGHNIMVFRLLHNNQDEEIIYEEREIQKR